MSKSRVKIGVSTLKAAATRDPNAWRDIFRVAYRAVTFILCQRFPNELEDVTQQAMVKIFNAIVREDFNQRHVFHTSDDDADVARWVGAIARNTAIDYYREHMKERPCVSIDDMHALTTSCDPILLLRLEEVLSELTEEQRAIVVLFYIEGLTQQEICTRLGIRLGTVKSRLSRVTKQMRVDDSDESLEDVSAEIEDYERPTHTRLRSVPDERPAIPSNIPQGPATRKSEGRK